MCPDVHEHDRLPVQNEQRSHIGHEHDRAHRLAVKGSQPLNLMRPKLRVERVFLANGLSELGRDELFKRGMQLIYGGSGDKKADRARH